MPEPAYADVVRQAVADLAVRLAVTPDTIQVASVTEVEWRDSSLGLPQAGQMYAQVITPGYRIELDTAAQRYRYHSDGRRVVFAGGI